MLGPSSLLRAVALARINFVLFCSQICLHITAMADPLGTSAITVTQLDGERDAKNTVAQHAAAAGGAT